MTDEPRTRLALDYLGPDGTAVAAHLRRSSPPTWHVFCSQCSELDPVPVPVADADQGLSCVKAVAWYHLCIFHAARAAVPDQGASHARA
ncbi:MAG: hypothetical protein ACYDH5_06620 [Acidimicrobiales bacterium]